MTDIRKKPFIANALTVRQLREIMSFLPDADEYGNEYEVWIGGQDNFSSSPATSVWALNKTEAGCDIIIEADGNNSCLS